MNCHTGWRVSCPARNSPALATGLEPLPRVEHSCLHVVAKVAADHVDTVGPLQFPLPSSHLDPWDPCETGSIGYVDFMLPDIERNGGWTSSAEGDVRIVQDRCKSQWQGFVTGPAGWQRKNS